MRPAAIVVTLSLLFAVSAGAQQVPEKLGIVNFSTSCTTMSPHPLGGASTVRQPSALPPTFAAESGSAAWRCSSSQGFKYVISLHADPVAFHIRNARLPCHDEIRREAKGEVPTALTS